MDIMDMLECFLIAETNVENFADYLQKNMPEYATFYFYHISTGWLSRYSWYLKYKKAGSSLNMAAVSTQTGH